MRPEPNELIAGIRAVLRETIGPELAGSPAVAALRRIMVILKETDWNEAAFLVRDENRVLADIAGAVEAWLRASGFPAAALPDLAPGGDAEGSFRAIAARNAALRGALADFVSGVAADERARSPEARALRKRMAAALIIPPRDQGENGR